MLIIPSHLLPVLGSLGCEVNVRPVLNNEEDRVETKILPARAIRFDDEDNELGVGGLRSSWTLFSRYESANRDLT